ncbi:hypothetical protein [Helicobacter suis]|uniref:hypothetical protein n=1 Tax=Helicobacter suis TaxID=104628 RepID=UPI0013CFB25E|nr:hypothetical protein [Helicobacter suis]
MSFSLVKSTGIFQYYDCIEDTTLLLKKNTAKIIAKIKQIYGVYAFEDLLLFDTLIGNTDRHLGNFGMLIDNNTNEFVRPAPIFDRYKIENIEINKINKN